MLPEQAKVMAGSGAPRWALFFRMVCKSSIVRAWSGFGDYALPADDVESEGGIYLGVGLVGSVPALRQLIGGLAERVEFSLNGADELTMALADRDADEVRRAQVHVGIVFFDGDWQQAAQIAWMWEGTADVPGVERARSVDGPVRRITLSVGTAFTDRTRPQLGFYTDADQRRRSSDDAFCARVAAYGLDSTIQWPGG